MSRQKKLLTSLPLALGLAVALFAGCGGSDDSGGGDSKLAEAVPADAPIYVEGALRPEGGQADALEAIGADFPGGEDLGGLITEKIDEALADEATAGEAPTFAADIDPWLGERAAFYAPNFEDSDSGAAVAEVTDEAKAQAAIEKLAASEPDPETDGEAAGVSYKVDSDGDAIAVNDGLLFLGPEANVKTALETAGGDGDNLAGADGFSDAVDRVDGSSALAFMYLNTERTIEVATEGEVTSTDPTEIDTFFEAVGVDKTKPISASVTPEGEEAHALFSVPVTNDREGGAAVLESLPGDATAAFSSATLGKDLGDGFVKAFEVGTANEGTPPEEAQAQIGAIGVILGFAPEELGDVVGAGGVFVTGTSMSDLKVGLVAEVTDPERMAKTVENVQTLIGGQAGTVTPLNVAGAETAYSIKSPDSPLPIEVAYSGEQLIVGGGNGSAELALNPGSTLADTSAFSDLSGSLDEAEPSVYVDTPKLIQLLRGAGELDDPDFAQAAPYVGALGQFAAGSTGVEDGYLISNAVMTFQKSDAPAPATAAPKPAKP